MKAKFVRELLEFDRANPRDTLGMGARWEIDKIKEEEQLGWWVKNDQQFLEYGVRILGEPRNAHRHELGLRMIELGIQVGASLQEIIDTTEPGQKQYYKWNNVIPGIVEYAKKSNDKDVIENLKQKIIDMFDNDIDEVIHEKDSQQKRAGIRNILALVNTFSEAMVGSPMHPGADDEYINKFKRREKQMYVLDFIQRRKNPPTRTEILSYSYQLSYGRGAKYSEGWGSTTFGHKGWVRKLTNKVNIPNNRAKGFVLNNVGRWTLEELKKKYESTGRKVPEKYEIDHSLLDDLRSQLEKLPV